MRIGVDARALAVPPAGIEVYTRNLVREMARLAPGHRFLLYSTKDFALPAPRSAVKRLGSGWRAAKGSVWMQAAVPALCARDRVDLFWSPLQTLPLGLSRTIPAVLTVHDFVQLVAPESMQTHNRAIVGLLARPSWRRADAFITGSHHTARRLRRCVGPGRSIRVIPHGPRDSLEAPDRSSARAWVRSAHGFEEPFVLAVGTLEPRKNLSLLVRAMAEAVRTEGVPHRLVLAGARGWKAEDLFRTVEACGMAARTVFTGALSDADLARLYRGADLFVYPSLYEGFGLPVLEAMAMGAPVVCSRSSSLPEVVGDAGVLFDPAREGDLAAVLRTLLKDAGARDVLARRGLARAVRFSWERAARSTLEVFEGAVATARRRRASAPVSWREEAGHFDRAADRILSGRDPQDLRVTEPTSWETSLVRDAFAFLGDLRDRAFLDYGCGWGHNAIFASGAGARIAVGFDVSRASLRLAAAKARASGVDGRVFFAAAAAERLPFRSKSFERVAGTGVLHHVDLDPAARELDRILAPAGRAAFAEPAGGNLLAEIVRRAVRYPRKSRTAGERALRGEEVRAFLGRFSGGTARPYYLLNGLVRAWRGYFPRGRADRLDRRLLAFAPFLRPLAAQVLLLLTGRGADA